MRSRGPVLPLKYVLFMLATAALSLPMLGQADSSGAGRSKLVTEGAVVPWRDTLFTLQGRVGSFSPQARADAVMQRIRKFGDNTFYIDDSLRTDTAGGAFDVVYRDVIVLSVTPKDTIGQGKGRLALTTFWRERIAKDVEAHRHSLRWTTLAKELALALLVIAILVLVLRVVGRAFRWTRAWLEAQTGARINGLKIRNYELFTAQRSLGALLLLNTALRAVVVLLVLYLTLPVLFGIFPWTQDLASTLFGYVTRPLGSMFSGLWNFLPNLITIVVIIVVFHYVVKGLAFLRNEVERGALTLPGFYPDWAAPTFQLLRIVLYAFMIVVIFPYLPGSDSPIFRGVTVFLGALFTFGSAGSLSNIIAGLMLTYMRAFQIGDRVKIGEVTGDVIERSMLVTRVRTIKNEIISIPNSTVIGSHTINYTSESVGRGLIVHTTVTIGYDAPWRQVHQLLIDAAKDTEMIKHDPEPFVLQTSLDDFYVSYQVNAYTDQPAKQATIYSLLHQNIQDRFNTAGVEIMSPHYLAARDGNATTIGSDRLPKDYVAPSFRVQDQTPRQP